MDSAKAGAEALSAGQTVDAVTQFTKALLVHPTSPDYLTQRSAAFTRLRPARHDLALKDAELAVLFGRKRASRKHIQAAQLRRVISLFHSARYAEAKYVLDTMEKWLPKEDKSSDKMAVAMSGGGEKKGAMEAKIWRSKVEKKLDETSQPAYDAGEYPEGELPSPEELTALYKSQLGADGKFNVEWQPGQQSTPVAPQEQSTSSTVPTPGIATASNPVPAKVRHEWYQNNQSVIITIYAKGVPKDKAEIDIQDDSVSISFPQPSDTSSLFEFTLDPLHALIDASTSKATIMSTKIEITLKKATPGQKWPALEGTQPLKSATNSSSDKTAQDAIMSTLRPTPATTDKAPAYPTSSRKGPKNWDKLANDLTKKKKVKKNDGSDESDDAMAVDDDDDEYGGDAVDGFFKKLYKDASPDTRRAMMKSYQESGGTALSTSWDEVSKKKVEPVLGKDDD